MATTKKKTEETSKADLQKIADELLKLMGTSATSKVTYDKKGDVHEVDIEAEEETGLLIGKKAETLLSLQTILGILLKSKSDEWKRVVVNIGDYREKEEDYLKDLAESTAQRARDTGEAQNLYNLKAWQRRIIHMFLAEEKDLITESQGEGAERYLTVKLK